MSARHDTPTLKSYNLAGKPDRLYRIVSIGQFRKVYIHHLVCATFVAPRPGLMGCAHLDGNRENNRATNLAWKTQKENEDDKKQHGTWYKRMTNCKLTEQMVRDIRMLDFSAKGSISAMAKKYGVTPQVLSRVISGKSWKHVA